MLAVEMLVCDVISKFDVIKTRSQTIFCDASTNFFFSLFFAYWIPWIDVRTLLDCMAWLAVHSLHN